MYQTEFALIIGIGFVFLWN